jgi:hypothetical protein
MEGESVAVAVALRVRPLLPTDEAEGATSCVTALSKTEIVLGTDRTFAFDRVFGSCSTQEELYSESVRQGASASQRLPLTLLP